MNELQKMKEFYSSLVDPRSLDYHKMFSHLPVEEILLKLEKDYNNYHRAVLTIQKAIKILEDQQVLAQARKIMEGSLR